MADLVIPFSRPIFDAQYDFYGRRLAVLSDKNEIFIYDMESTSSERLHTVVFEHNASRLEWAHPSMGSYFATAGGDKVCIFKEVMASAWQCIFHEEAQCVTALAWAPQELSNWLIYGTDNGMVTVVKNLSAAGFDTSNTVKVHSTGVTALAWLRPPSDLLPSSGKRFLSGSESGEVSMVELEEDQVSVRLFMSAQSPIVSIATSMARPLAAISSKNGKIEVVSTEALELLQSIELDGREIQLSWSALGSVLAASCNDDSVVFFEQGAKGSWRKSKSSISSE
mmetsp:Transcript_9664/g.18914  ORF Transcript_9664/g.18914 Transcript_9664/m.18914 type:complete len:281 (-) Transcript_9664:20-862(-)